MFNLSKILPLIGYLLLLVSNAQPAQAETDRAEIYQYISASGDTVFPGSVSQTCLGKRTINYRTRYGGTTYQGTLDVDDDNCDATGRGLRVSGIFEERSRDGEQRCRGRLSVYTHQYPDSRNYAKWDSIEAVPGYYCSGTGTQPILTLQRQ
jgi:hypothetical protein